MIAGVKRTTLVLAAIMIGACTAPAPPAAEAPPAREPAVPGNALSQRCTNAAHGFTVSYPEGWHINDGEVLPACSAFAPAPIEIPRNSELPFEIAVVIDVEDVPADQLTRSSQFERVLSASQLSIGGRSASRVEVEATGEGLADRGMRSVRYVVDLGGGRTLIATTHRVGDTFERNAQILGQMMDSITFP